jgi:hypothetical protein
MKPNKPVKQNKHELPAIVRAAWAIDFAVRTNKEEQALEAITALRAEADRLEAEVRIAKAQKELEDDAYAQAEYDACSDAAYEKHLDQKAQEADQDPR